ncbi:cyclic 2,3-diphosphoglycerate synthase [Candidatus Bipolaricaulota bacterium]|nr:cyclic 2,3-diphosphoglycerate synthase [Candidatus Bipolaricaulota bacterium]MCF7890257.1 cyclic 2,3-diphosphoglycerate synthase [Candidatus Bipolaricaulota bacterium]
MGAAGRDFHNFNTYFREKEEVRVVAFTAAQIPDITGREYPPELAGDLYPEGIPIEAEEDLPELIKAEDVDEVVFSYSDVPHQYVMERASLVNASGADFKLLSPQHTTLKSSKPLISITAVRTGSGKSQTTRRVTDILRGVGKQVAVIRHPMPYGDLVAQKAQRFETYDDMDKHDCTIEEREEYEPHIDRGNLVFAGVDYEEILSQAEQEADVIVWDGGNNDFSFYESDFSIVMADPLRAGHEMTYYPGNVSIRMADLVVINKVETATPDKVNEVRKNVRKLNPDAEIIEACSPITVEDPSIISDNRVLVIEDGPTVTHGEMDLGAGTLAAKKYGAGELIDPEPHAVGSLKETFKTYPHIPKLLPAMGYGKEQIEDLNATIKNCSPDAVVIGTPIDLRRLIDFEVPTTRVTYELQEIGSPTLADVLSNLEVL